MLLFIQVFFFGNWYAYIFFHFESEFDKIQDQLLLKRSFLLLMYIHTIYTVVSSYEYRLIIVIQRLPYYIHKTRYSHTSKSLMCLIKYLFLFHLFMILCKTMFRDLRV